MRSWTPALLLPVVLLAPLHAQNPKLEREINFVRDLATRLRFISLAQSEVDRMLQRYKDPEDFKDVSQLGIEISLIGAKLHPNREERRTLFQGALERSKDLLERYPDLRPALMTLADASLEFGRFLADDIEIARIEEPAKVKDLEAQADVVFRDGVATCEKAMASLESVKDSDDRAKIDYHVTWMRKGILLREHGRAKKSDRGYLCERSRSTLEELILEVGEETALGQRALFEYSMNDEVTGDLDSAVVSYGDVIDTINLVLGDEEQELPYDVRLLMVNTLEEAYDRVAATLFQQGKTEDVLKTVDRYRENLKELGVPLTNLDNPSENPGQEDPKFGHSLYVTAARAMAETGTAENVDRATKLCQHFNDLHPTDFVGLRAKVALKEILSSPGRKVSGKLLLEIAKGDYQAQEYETAIAGFKRAIAAMGPDEGATNGLEAYYLMGNAFALQGRFLESTFAVKRGLEVYGKITADDTFKERSTSLLRRASRQVQANAKGDDFYDPLADQVANLAAEFGSATDAAKRSYSEGNRMMSEALAKRDAARATGLDEAIASFRRVTQESPYYELAQARICRALQFGLKYDEAREAIAAYRAFTESPEGRIKQDRNDLRHARVTAQAEVDFCEGYMTYLEAIGRGPKSTPDPTKLPQVIELLGDYETKHGGAATAQLPSVYFILGRSYVEMGKLDKAEESYRILKQKAPRHNNVAGLASAIFSAYDRQVTAKETEVNSIAQQNKPELLAEVRGQLEALRRKTVSIGLDYFDGSDNPQFSISYNTLKQLEALKDWERVESFGNRVIATFENDPKSKGKVDEFVRAILGDALLRQHKYQQAYDMLIAVEKVDPKNYPIKRLICLALGGWAEIDERGAIKPYYGLGRPAEAYDKYWTEYKTYGLNRTRGVERYTLPWYDYYWELYFFASAAAKSDSKFVDRAKKIYGTAQSTDDFKNLLEKGLEGQRLHDLFVSAK